MASDAISITERHEGFSQYELDRDSDEAVEQRLTLLYELNSEFAAQKGDRKLGVFDWKPSATGLISYEKAFALFGAMLGIFPPVAIFLRIYLQNANSQAWLVGVLLIVNIIAAVVGFFTGKTVGRALETLASKSWWSQFLLSPFIGLTWGIVTGMAAGVIFFIVGGLVGGVIGGLVGLAALPPISLLLKLTGIDERIEFNRFMPIGMGVALVISGLIFRL